VEDEPEERRAPSAEISTAQRPTGIPGPVQRHPSAICRAGVNNRLINLCIYQIFKYVKNK